MAKSDNHLKKTVVSQLKDITPTLQQSHVVYEVSCQCEKKYVGQTRQHLKERLKQHNNGVAIDGTVKNKEKTATTNKPEKKKLQGCIRKSKCSYGTHFKFQTPTSLARYQNPLQRN